MVGSTMLLAKNLSITGMGFLVVSRAYGLSAAPARTEAVLECLMHGEPIATEGKHHAGHDDHPLFARQTR
jgi:hypothetical protein